MTQIGQMTPYIIFDIKEELEGFSRRVDTALGFPRLAAGDPAEGSQTYATPIKKYDSETYAYPITPEISHLVPPEKKLLYDLSNWCPDAII
jgi:hypothetical protein